jgi:hypothetical protein
MSQNAMSAYTLVFSNMASHRTISPGTDRWYRSAYSSMSMGSGPIPSCFSSATMLA